MKVDLKSYLDSRDENREQQNTPGPVITISRDFGCAATPLAMQLIHKIADESQAKSNQAWHIISKEILEDAAKTLHVNQMRIEKLMESEHAGAISSLFSSLGSSYGVSDKHIIETLRDVIYHYAHQGKTIIIGRGGAHITKKISDAVHIKLEASLEWRINQIQQSKKISHSEAAALVAEMDHKRDAWIEHLSNAPADPFVYDLTINRALVDDESIVDIIMTLLKKRKLIAYYHTAAVH